LVNFVYYKKKRTFASRKEEPQSVIYRHEFICKQLVILHL